MWRSGRPTSPGPHWGNFSCFTHCVFTTRPTLQGTFGMASSTHWLASATAMAVLEDGGNAFDAAVAAGFVLHVVEPHLNGPAGEVRVANPSGLVSVGAVVRRNGRGWTADSAVLFRTSRRLMQGQVAVPETAMV